MHVDQFDLVGLTYYCVGDRFALRDPSDAFDDVVQTHQVLDVDGGNDVDSSVEEFVDVLPTLLVTTPGHVGVREFVDQHQRGPSGENGIQIHLLKRRPAIVDAPTRYHLKVANLFRSVQATVRFDEPNDDIGAPFAAATPFVQHRERLTDAGRS